MVFELIFGEKFYNLKLENQNLNVRSTTKTVSVISKTLKKNLDPGAFSDKLFYFLNDVVIQLIFEFKNSFGK